LTRNNNPTETAQGRLMNSAFRSSIFALIALFAVSATGYAKEKAAKDDNGKTDASQTIAKVNGKAIPKARADAIAEAQAAQGHPDSEDLRKTIRENLIQGEVLAQEAIKKGFDKRPQVKIQMDLASQNVLINAYVNDFVKNHPVADEALKKEYDGIRAQLGDKEYKARHVLVDKEDEAKAIIEKLNKGEKFEDLAKESKDPGSKDKGGDLGWAAPSSYVKPFSDALTKLEKGKFTTAPVKSDFGFHVILLEDTRDLKVPAFDDVKQQLTQRMQQRQLEQHFAELRAKAKVE
jgi:peptidyl-prolyl cis-trans isomerase C